MNDTERYNKWRNKNLEKRQEYERQYREKNKEKIKESLKIWYQRNKELQKEKSKKYRLEHAEWKKKYDSDYGKTEKVKKYRKEWGVKNRDKMNVYQKERFKRDIIFRISHNCRTRIKIFIRKGLGDKKINTFKYIGCNWTELKEHIENKFVNGMTWDNYGKWHIDHIIPLSSSKAEEDVIRLCHYTNLQPLWAIDNLRKSNKYEK